MPKRNRHDRDTDDNRDHQYSDPGHNAVSFHHDPYDEYFTADPGSDRYTAAKKDSADCRSHHIRWKLYPV